jgi:Cu/Ag efflux protein CusF
MTASAWNRGFPVLLAALAVSQGCATSKGKEASTPPTYQTSRTETATAVVQALDLKTRRVTLKDEDGKLFSFVAGDHVRNLAQVHVGDKVKVTYTESLALEVKRADGSAPDATASTSMSRAAPGEKPAGTVAGVVTASAVIVAIDRETNRVTLKGPEGNFQVLQVKDPKKLENVQVGDMVYATYTESVGISVESVPPAPAK